MFDNNPFREYKKMIRENNESMTKEVSDALHDHYEEVMARPYHKASETEQLKQDDIVDAAMDRAHRDHFLGELNAKNLIKSGKEYIIRMLGILQ